MPDAVMSLNELIETCLPTRMQMTHRKVNPGKYVHRELSYFDPLVSCVIPNDTKDMVQIKKALPDEKFYHFEPYSKGNERVAAIKRCLENLKTIEREATTPYMDFIHSPNVGMHVRDFKLEILPTTKRVRGHIDLLRLFHHFSSDGEVVMIHYKTSSKESKFRIATHFVNDVTATALINQWTGYASASGKASVGGAETSKSGSASLIFYVCIPAIPVDGVMSPIDYINAAYVNVTVTGTGKVLIRYSGKTLTLSTLSHRKYLDGSISKAISKLIVSLHSHINNTNITQTPNIFDVFSVIRSARHVWQSNVLRASVIADVDILSLRYRFAAFMNPLFTPIYVTPTTLIMATGFFPTTIADMRLYTEVKYHTCGAELSIARTVGEKNWSAAFLDMYRSLYSDEPRPYDVVNGIKSKYKALEIQGIVVVTKSGKTNSIHVDYLNDTNSNRLDLVVLAVTQMVYVTDSLNVSVNNVFVPPSQEEIVEYREKLDYRITYVTGDGEVAEDDLDEDDAAQMAISHDDDGEEDEGVAVEEETGGDYLAYETPSDDESDGDEFMRIIKNSSKAKAKKESAPEPAGHTVLKIDIASINRLYQIPMKKQVTAKSLGFVDVDAKAALALTDQDKHNNMYKSSYGILPLKHSNPTIFDVRKYFRPFQYPTFSSVCKQSKGKCPVAVTDEEYDALVEKNLSAIPSVLHNPGAPTYKYICPSYWCPLTRQAYSISQFRALGNKCPDFNGSHQPAIKYGDAAIRAPYTTDGYPHHPLISHTTSDPYPCCGAVKKVEKKPMSGVSTQVTSPKLLVEAGRTTDVAPELRYIIDDGNLSLVRYAGLTLTYTEHAFAILASDPINTNCTVPAGTHPDEHLAALVMANMTPYEFVTLHGGITLGRWRDSSQVVSSAASKKWWARNHNGYTVNTDNEGVIAVIYSSFLSFVSYLRDGSSTKTYMDIHCLFSECRHWLNASGMYLAVVTADFVNNGSALNVDYKLYVPPTVELHNVMHGVTRSPKLGVIVSVRDIYYSRIQCNVIRNLFTKRVDYFSAGDVRVLRKRLNDVNVSLTQLAFDKIVEPHLGWSSLAEYLEDTSTGLIVKWTFKPDAYIDINGEEVEVNTTKGIMIPPRRIILPSSTEDESRIDMQLVLTKEFGRPLEKEGAEVARQVAVFRDLLNINTAMRSIAKANYNNLTYEQMIVVNKTIAYLNKAKQVQPVDALVSAYVSLIRAICTPTKHTSLYAFIDMPLEMQLFVLYSQRNAQLKADLDYISPEDDAEVAVGKDYVVFSYSDISGGAVSHLVHNLKMARAR